MLRKDVKSQLFSTGMLISLLLGLVLLVEPQYQYFLYFARWDNKADYINFFFSSLALGGYLIFTPIITVMPGVLYTRNDVCKSRSKGSSCHAHAHSGHQYVVA